MKYVELLNEVQKEWTVKEKVRYLYQNVCKNSSYDERFVYSRNKDLLRKIYDRTIDINEEEDPRLVCHTLNKVLYQLLSELKIKCKIIYKKSGIERPIDIEDVALIFWDEEGNKYYTSIVGDIENCKFGLRTEFFGITQNLYEEAQDVKRISLEELQEMDIKTGSIKSEYNDMVFKLLASEVKNKNDFKNFLKEQGLDVDNMSRDDILRNKIYFLTNLIKFRDKTAGPDEMKKFYKRLFSASVLDKFESTKFNTYEYFKENGEEVDILSILEIMLKDKNIYYIYSEDKQTYIQLLPEEVLERIRGYSEKKGKKLLIEQNKVYEGEEY